jgi:hypothetical protein
VGKNKKAPENNNKRTKLELALLSEKDKKFDAKASIELYKRIEIYDNNSGLKMNLK